MRSTTFCNYLGLVAQARQSSARGPWLLPADDLLNVVNATLTKPLGIERRCACQQLVEQNTERIYVRTSVHILIRHVGLLRTHILRCAKQLALLGVRCLLRQWLRDSLGYPEVDNLRYWSVVLNGHQDVRWLDIPVYDSFLMRVMNALTDLSEEFESFLDA